MASATKVGLYSLCLQRGYQLADFSVVYPIARGTGPMLSSVGAFLFLAETPSVQGVLGLLAIVAGIGMIAIQGDLSAFRRSRGLDGVRWGRRPARSSPAIPSSMDTASSCSAFTPSSSTGSRIFCAFSCWRR